jgi:predicted aconitase with swiveling domain
MPIEDDDPLEAPTALPWLQSQPVLIIGAIMAGLIALSTAIADGFQTYDLIPVGIAVCGALIAKTQVFSQKTVDEIQPSRAEQQRAVKRAKRK